MNKGIPVRKRVFDIVLITVASPLIIIVLAISSAAIFLSSGSPVFYRSKRRVFRNEGMIVVKFRTMKKNAERVANRDVVPISDTRFLNISIDSPLYTPVGRIVERLMLTELPQLFHVIFGRMSLVGNRPLPENVIAALLELYPTVEDRFEVPCGLTGPVQLVGRTMISDRERLWLEGVYCRVVRDSYSVLLDLKILFCTVAVGLVPRLRFTPQQVFALMVPPEKRVGLEKSPPIKMVR